jgi:hypothetical protein
LAAGGEGLVQQGVSLTACQRDNNRGQ